ncbi:adenosine receptor A3-like [Oculina patagonica]
MVAQFCTQRLEANAKLVHFHETFLKVYCAANLVFSCAAIFGNVLVIRALWKASSIPPTLKKLFLSLAVSDLAVGLIGQLMFGVIGLVMLNIAASGNYNFKFFCPIILTTYYFVLFLLACASFLNVTAIAVDRLLVLYLHLRYQELVTSWRVAFALASLWLTSGVIASIFIFLPSRNNIVAVVTEFLGVIVTTVAYIYVYKVVKYHQNQIKIQIEVQHDREVKVHREQKSSFNVLFIYIVFVACNMPNLFSAILVEADEFRRSFLIANHITVFLVLLNSSLNPLIYCWRYREIREIVKSIVRKAFRFT